MSAITTREEIIDEIRHLARRIGRSPGKDFFQKETRIPEGHWYGRYWLSWGDALKEAGLEANQVPPKIPDNELLEHYAKAVRHFRKIPSKAQLKMHRAGGNPDLPADTTFRKRFGNKQSRNAALWKFVQENSQFADLIDLVPEPKDDDILLRLNWPEFSVGTESIYRSALSSRSLHFVGMNDAKISITLSEEERTALEAVCRRRKVEALVWKRARAFLLLDAGEDARTVCRILDIGPTVLTEWKSAFAAMGLSFFGLKDYSPRQGHLSFAQEAELKAHFSNTPPRNADEVCAHILAEYGQSYCSSGAAKLMSRLGFEYRKPQVLPTRAAEAAQEAFIAAYEALMRRLDDDEMVVFSDAVHPTHQSRPAHGWFPKDQKTAIKASSGRKRLNIQGAIDLETFSSPLSKPKRSMLARPARCSKSWNWPTLQ